MTIEQIFDRLKDERKIGCRYAARAIFVENLAAYKELVTQLTNECDVSMNIADFAKHEDGLPRFEKLRLAISSHEGKHLLLLSVGEYLRMCIKRETAKATARFQDFWELQQDRDSKTRVIMPIFSARDCFDRVVKTDERTEHYIWQLDPERPIYSADHRHSAAAESYVISVYSPQFSEVIEADANNFADWLRNWASILERKPSCSVVSQQLRNAEDTFGTITLKTVDRPFAYIMELLGKPALDPDWESDDFWVGLIPSAKACGGFDALVSQKLSMPKFDFPIAMARWSILTDEQKELVWMWYRVHPTGEYYSYACKKANSAREIPERIRDEILLLESRSDTWIKERMAALKALRFEEFDEDYFRLLDRLRLPKMKFQLLTFKTSAERAYAIRVVSDMLRNGVKPDTIATMIKDDYAALATYITGASGLDEEVDQYFAWYRENKLINRFPGDHPKRIAFERFDSRYKRMQTMAGKDCFEFWIDGFGMEWLPVFIYELAKCGITPNEKYITTALLPTETKYNHQWDEKDPTVKKWGLLDKLSHGGEVDNNSYFSCIDHQLGVLAKAAKEVKKRLNSYEYVVITGDHGSSRMAGLAFHDKALVPVMPPAGSIVRCHGRFIELSDNGDSYVPLSGMEKTKHSNGKSYVVMCDYRHFKQSGNVAGGNDDAHDVPGEVHGGNTPEERLVPVIIVKRKKPLPPLKCNPFPNADAIRKRGHVDAVLEFNRDVYSLEAFIGHLDGKCDRLNERRWKISFDGTVGNTLRVSVVANGALLPDTVELRVKPQGLSRNDHMGGLP